MDLDSIIAIFVGALPAVTSIGTGIGIMIKVIKNFDNLKKEVRDRTDLDQFREQMNKILEENYKLKEQISQLIEYSKQHPVIKTKSKTKED